jgi:uncharacterized cupredoxin-like copper-binding protein
MRRETPERLLAVAAVIALALAGCTNGGASPSAGDGEATTVAVTLQEWAVVPEADSAPAGDIVFSVTNDGPEDVHEFVVLATDLDPAELPVDENGVVSEEGEGIEVIDEIEDIAVGDSQDLEVTLEAGNYVLICNIWSEDEGEAHYAMGMRTAFTVEE